MKHWIKEFSLFGFSLFQYSTIPVNNLHSILNSLLLFLINIKEHFSVI